MDDLEQKHKRPGLIWNLLSIIVLLVIIVLVILIAIIVVNPYSFLNPFPPGQLPTLMTFPTASNTSQSLPTTDLPNTIQTVESSTVFPTWTPTPSITPTQPGLSEQPSITPGGSGMAYVATIDYVDSTFYHQDAGCNWVGVAGQALDINNAPVLYLAIHIQGTVGGKFIDYTSATGTAPGYGRAGFEFYLGDRPFASVNDLVIQLTDQQNLPLTDPIQLTTYNDCAKNLILIRFKQVH